MADPIKQTVECWRALDDASFVPVDRSVELGVTMGELRREIDWP